MIPGRLTVESTHRIVALVVGARTTAASAGFRPSDLGLDAVDGTSTRCRRPAPATPVSAPRSGTPVPESARWPDMSRNATPAARRRT
ncbi:hypothetical protein GCM10010269_17920 [Streptomyces humidus]|uniref:Uncharacterized protein n=2 Tax=Streptomyces humidus TaxID=52259 RepID=A0A918FTF7_9ACTN|nr:hypothetical protein GCM10010269_17920 [Streptomyces humidus]